MIKKIIFTAFILTIAFQSICISEQSQSINRQPEQTEKPRRYEGRKNINEEISLQEALDNFNPYFSAPELTVDEVVAAIRSIKVIDPSIPDDVLVIYNRVANEKVLPKNMDFSSIGWWRIDGYDIKVDWRDLELSMEDSGIGKGYGLRIRSRYISANKPSAEEIAQREKMRTKKNLTIYGKMFSKKDLEDPKVQKWLDQQKKKEQNK